MQQSVLAFDTVSCVILCSICRKHENSKWHRVTNKTLTAKIKNHSVIAWKFVDENAILFKRNLCQMQNLCTGRKNNCVKKNFSISFKLKLSTVIKIGRFDSRNLKINENNRRWLTTTQNTHNKIKFKKSTSFATKKYLQRKKTNERVVTLRKSRKMYHKCHRKYTKENNFRRQRKCIINWLRK